MANQGLTYCKPSQIDGHTHKTQRQSRNSVIYLTSVWYCYDVVGIHGICRLVGPTPFGSSGSSQCRAVPHLPPRHIAFSSTGLLPVGRSTGGVIPEWYQQRTVPGSCQKHHPIREKKSLSQPPQAKRGTLFQTGVELSLHAVCTQLWTTTIWEANTRWCVTRSEQTQRGWSGCMFATFGPEPTSNNCF